MLAFLNFFDNNEIIKKSLFSKGVIGFIGKKTSPRLGIDIFEFFDTENMLEK